MLTKNQKQYVRNELHTAEKDFQYCLASETMVRACIFIKLFDMAELVFTGDDHDRLFNEYYKTYEICERYHDKLKPVKNAPV